MSKTRKSRLPRTAAGCRGVVQAVALLSGLTGALSSTQALAQACADQPAGIPPGVYASALQKEISLSKGSDSISMGPGYTGFADEPRLTCLDETPEFIRRDPLPSPGGFAADAGACGFGGGGGGSPDFGLSSEWPRMERRFADEIENFVSSGYPTNSIIMHAVAAGLTMDKTLYLMTRADSDRAAEFFNAAFALEASLPGWSCSAGTPGRGGAFSQYYGVNDLPPKRTVAEVARRYFEESLIMEPFPDWFSGDFHMLAYTDELVDLAQDGYWYQNPGRTASEGSQLVRPILVSLYGETEEIVLDISADELRAFQARGVERLPVVFYFNKDYQRPVTDIRNDQDLAGLIDSFENDGAELTPVPLLGSGDYHVHVTADEMEELFEIPDREDIDPVRYQELVSRLQADGFGKGPAVVTLYSGGNSRWLDDAERIRAAIDLGMEEVPVALLYHRLQRMPCGSSTSCVRRICDAVVCAGGAPTACLEPPAAGGVRETEPLDSVPPPPEGGNPSPS